MTHSYQAARRLPSRTTNMLLTLVVAAGLLLDAGLLDQQTSVPGLRTLRGHGGRWCRRGGAKDAHA